MSLQSLSPPHFASNEYLIDVPLSAVDPDPNNERTDILEDLDDLVSSMKSLGLQERVRLYSLLNGRYLIASGHRRVAAARFLGWSSVPAVVTPSAGHAVNHTISRLASNLCRKDIDPISLALSVRTLREQYSVSLHDCALWLGKSPTSVSNLLRLLDLPAPVQDKIRSGTITVGHALQLLRIQDDELDWFGNTIATSEECQIRLARAVEEENLSIRALEVRVRNLIGNNRAIHEWLSKQKERPQPTANILANSAPISNDQLTFAPSSPNNSNIYDHETRTLTRASIHRAISFDRELGPTNDHLRLAALILSDEVYMYHSTFTGALPEHAQLIRNIEKATTQLEILNILGQLVNAAIIDDLNDDATDFVGNRRTRWAKSHFNIQSSLQEALHASR
jgi:ParB/RepB/Spo0J family partition protein